MPESDIDKIASLERAFALGYLEIRVHRRSSIVIDWISLSLSDEEFGYYLQRYEDGFGIRQFGQERFNDGDQELMSALFEQNGWMVWSLWTVYEGATRPMDGRFRFSRQRRREALERDVREGRVRLTLSHSGGGIAIEWPNGIRRQAWQADDGRYLESGSDPVDLTDLAREVIPELSISSAQRMVELANQAFAPDLYRGELQILDAATGEELLRGPANFEINLDSPGAGLENLGEGALALGRRVTIEVPLGSHIQENEPEKPEHKPLWQPRRKIL